jgi:hypothetical protein
LQETDGGCINGLSVNIMPTKMIALTDTDFLLYRRQLHAEQSAGDGYPQGRHRARASRSTPTARRRKRSTFTCDELGTQLVELWSIDLAGNADYLRNVRNRSGQYGCGPAGSSATVAGALKTETDKGLMDGHVELNGTPPNGLPPVSTFDMSDNAGLYVFSNALPLASNYTIVPTKDDGPLNGVTTFDLVIINKHILGLEPMTSPYKMIAADANSSRSITTFDIVELRKLILGLYDELPANTSWRFVDKAYQFPNPSNPFQEVFPETMTVANVQNNHFTDDFVAVKVGDVNGNATANLTDNASDRSAGTAFFDIAEQTVKAGETVVVNFKAADKLAGYQFTLNFNGLQVEEVLPGENMTTGNFAVFAADNAITTSVDGAANEFAIRFRATQNGSLSQMLSAGSRITKAEAYPLRNDAMTNDVMTIVLRFNGANGAVVAGEGFELMQNTPNPVANTTNIAFNLPEAGSATLTISNVEGRVIKVVKGDYAKGLNNVTLQKSDLVPGVLFYQLDTKGNSATKKMIVTE